MTNQNYARIVAYGALTVWATAGMPLWAQCHEQKIFASNPGPAAFFGRAIAADSTRLIVGSPGDDEAGVGAGAVYVFESPDWTQAAKLVPGSSNLNLGVTVALSGDRLIAGDIFGNVYSFEDSGGTWQPDGILVDPDGGSSGFGGAIDVDGDWIAVGAPSYDDGPEQDAGAVYLFRNISGTWNFFQRLTWDSMSGHQFMGRSVAIEGNELIVGTPEAVNCAGFGAGAVLVFEFDGFDWNLVQEIYSPDICNSAAFGWSLDRDENDLVVSAPFTPDSLPRTFVFNRNAGSWQHEDSLIGPSSAFHWAGYLSIENGVVAVATAAFRKLIPSWTYAGSLRALDRLNGEFDSVSAVAVANERVFVGVADDADMGNNAGAVYVIAAPTDWTWGYCMDQPCPCGNEVHKSGGGCANSAGSGDRGSILDACGTPSVVADDLILTADLLPPNKTGIFFMGGSQIAAPFGDGLRCVGAGGMGIYRYLPPLNSGPLGRASLGPGIVARSQGFVGEGPIDPGETWNFQYWYRDPMGPCGSAFNLSSARAVMFQP